MRGGKRPGSGRKAFDPGIKRVQIALTIHPDTYAKLRQLKKNGINVSRYFEQYVEEFGIE